MTVRLCDDVTEAQPETLLLSACRKPLSFGKAAKLQPFLVKIGFPGFSHDKNLLFLGKNYFSWEKDVCLYGNPIY